MTDTRRRRRRTRSRRWRALWAGGLVVVLAAGLGWLAFDRYLPALDEARSLQADVVSLASRVESAGMEIDRQGLDEVEQGIAATRGKVDQLGTLLESDPLIGLARALPLSAADVHGADAILEAARRLLDAADHGLLIGRRFVELKERATSTASGDSTLASMVELMATTRSAAVDAQQSVTSAAASLDRVPRGLAGPIEAARSTMADKIHTYLPLLDAYVEVSARLPAMLGWDAPRRYLVLTQNPAELRPTGGYIGSYGIVVFDRAHVVEHTFRDVFLLDGPDNPFIAPPEDLQDYVLGSGQGWQLSDANWSPDFPTSAQVAARLYASESQDADIDGVLGITTHTIDELLQVTGPVAVPGYDATISSGETTLKTLQLTRVAEPGEDRKAFLSAFADELFARLIALPPNKWTEMVGHVDRFRSQRLLLAWFKDQDDQAMAAATGFDGAVRQDPGDFLYPVDANVTPASKINAIATRSLRLDVSLDDVGNALNTLEVSWDNPIDTPAGAPIRELPTLEDLRILGTYFRLLVPERSRVEEVSGGTLDELTGPAIVDEEAGRAVIGTYLMIPPGEGGLRYIWTSPYVVETEEIDSRYRLTIQKQPGLLPGPALGDRSDCRRAGRIISASAGVTSRGNTATLSTTFDRDIQLEVRFD